tara:strand:- start:3947 stop:4633 length:687 start_codon:yes stop_codon:yes gene_type:complete
MVVGTVFIMIFGMATVTLVDSVNESVSNSDHKLENPEVIIVSVTDKEESTGPAKVVSIQTSGDGYADDDAGCTTSGNTGTGLTVSVDTVGASSDGPVSAVYVDNPGDGYSTGGGFLTISGCGDGTASFILGPLHDQNTITIKNTGSENARLSHIIITLSNTTNVVQGKPFAFTSHYSGTNLYLFPGEEISSDHFPLDSTTHGFDIGEDPDRAFLAIYDHNDAMTVTTT